MTKQDYKELGNECVKYLTLLNPTGGIREHIRMAVEFGYKKALNKKLNIPDVGSSTSSVIKITNVDILLLKRQWWQVYKKGWHKHQDLYNRKWWIKYNG